MEFNGKDDYLSRWIHGICALFLVVVGVTLAFPLYAEWGSRVHRLQLTGGGIVVGCLYLAYRCARYAITGEKNVNEEYMWRGR